MLTFGIMVWRGGLDWGGLLPRVCAVDMLDIADRVDMVDIEDKEPGFTPSTIIHC